QRPNSLDLRVDSIPRATLLTEPATALVDPARQAAALRRAHWTVMGWLLTALFEALALFYLWSSGGAAALRDWLRRRIAPEWGVRFLFGASLALVARLAAFLPSFYLYRVDRTLELTFELTRWWALYWVFHTVLAMVIAGLIAAVVLWLASRTHQWYVYAIVGILAASVAWSYLAQYVTSSASHFVRARNGVMVRVPDRSVAGSTPPEIAYVAAYELGHVVNGDRLSVALIEGGVIIVFSAIAVVLADRIRFRRDDDPLSRLAIVGALLALVYIAAVPVRNAALRSYDFGADRYAVALTGDPASAVRTLVREGDQHMEEVCPEWTATLFLYTAPGIGARVAAINRVPNACP
ncbi:MAG TPA: M48 family metalloprotease, partial [Candidatus Dormibacteraeota bacterium]|nr:M48 family metalloprotease [Candidatus Dormibacteraeota bacterium]